MAVEPPPALAPWPRVMAADAPEVQVMVTVPVPVRAAAAWLTMGS